MARSKQASKRKGRRRTLPVVGAAGVSLAVAGGASATGPTEHTPPRDTAPRPIITLGEEEISDVNLATFYVFDKENIEFGDRVQLARRGCGGCGCRGCAVRGLSRLRRLRLPRLRGASLGRLQLWRLWRRLRLLRGVDGLGLDPDLLAENERPAGGCEPAWPRSSWRRHLEVRARPHSRLEARFVRTSGRRCAY